MYLSVPWLSLDWIAQGRSLHHWGTTYGKSFDGHLLLWREGKDHFFLDLDKIFEHWLIHLFLSWGQFGWKLYSKLFEWCIFWMTERSPVPFQYRGFQKYSACRYGKHQLKNAWSLKCLRFLFVIVWDFVFIRVFFHTYNTEHWFLARRHHRQ